MADDKFEIDYFISRRGSAADVAKEIAAVLADAGHTTFTQDHTIPYGANFVGAIDRALQRCRHFIALLSKDYRESPYTEAEWMNFYAAAQSDTTRRFIVLRVDDLQPRGLLAGIVFGDLVGVTDKNARRSVILAAAKGLSTADPELPRLFDNVPPRDINFTGRDARLADLHTDASAPTAIT